MTNVTRRQVLTTLGITAAAACTPRVEKLTGAVEGSAAEKDPIPKRVGKDRMPTVFVPHGGGPWPFVESGFGAPGVLEAYLRKLTSITPVRPKALLVISAHWEESVPTVMTAPVPPMYYDYYGFPEAAYRVEWPAPGYPELAGQVRDRLEAAGIRSTEDSNRGFDHGTFVVGAVAYPNAGVPTFQLSLKRGLDPAAHLALGRALIPFRDEGVFIVGSGMSYHNLQRFMDTIRGRGGPIREESRAFDDWLSEAVGLEPSALETRLVEWDRAPSARACHPREEHLLPLMVVAGAAGDDPGSVPYRDVIYGAHTSAVQFG